MSKKANIIELNGKSYDSVTGKLLGSRSGDADAHKPSQAIDGFIRPSLPSNVVHKTTDHHKVDSQPHHITVHKAGPKTIDVVHHAVAPHTTAHHPEHTKTLMRHSVHRPAASLKRHTKAITHTGALVAIPDLGDIELKHSVNTTDNNRLKRAEHIARSSLISRFGNLLQSTSSSPTPAAKRSVATAATTRYVTAPAAKQPSTDIFERALQRANSHNQPAPVRKHITKKSHRLHHIGGVTAASLAALLIVGFIAYQNTANIQMRIASSRAGINATMPGWHPAGYAAKKFTYSPGTVAVNFQNTAEPRSFNLSQTTSNWDSSTLLNDFVAAKNDTYQTIQSDGNTIYTYGNNNATWVSGGIWYKLTTNGALSTNQLVELATST